MVQEFSSFAGLARHLNRLASAGDAVTHQITKDALKIVRDDAQTRIGMYQEAVGPFPAWAPLADSTIADRIRHGYTPFDPLLRTGDMRASIGITVDGHSGAVGSASEIALYQEQGTKNIPPRPFLGPALYEGKERIAAHAARTVIAWVGGLPWRKPPQLLELP